MAKNSKSDVAQLQAAFAHINKDGKAYWDGAIEGIMTEDLKAAIRKFQSDHSIPVTGYISPSNEDMTRLKIILFCIGTPYAKLRGLWGTSIVFSVFKVPKTTAQHLINGLGPWQEAMDVALKDTKLAAGLYSLPLNIDPNSLKIVVIEGRAHLKFHVSTKKVKWLDNTSRTFGNDMPDKAKSLVTHSVASDTIMAWLGDGLSFITKTHVDFIDVAPKSTQEVTKVMNIIGEYESARAKQEVLREKIKKLVPEVQRIMAEFQKEHAIIQENLDGRLRNAIGDAATAVIEDKAWKGFSYALGRMGHKDWKVVIKGFSSKALFIMDIYERAIDAWHIVKAGSFLTEQFFILTNELEPKAKKIKTLQGKIASIESINISSQLSTLKQYGVNTERLKKYYEEHLHALRE